MPELALLVPAYKLKEIDLLMRIRA